MGNKTKQNKKRFFYPPEYEVVNDCLNGNGKFTAKFMINTGARLGECRWFMSNPVFDKERYNITFLRTKIRARLKEKIPEQRTIPISKTFFEELKRELPTHKVLSTNAFNIALRNAIKKYNESVEVHNKTNKDNPKQIIQNPNEFSSHNLRKTFATWMLSLGVDGFRLAKHLGHTPNELARDYATNDVFNSNDKMIMRSILKDLPERFFQNRRY